MNDYSVLYLIESPQSTTTCVPVISLDSLPARKHATLAIPSHDASIPNIVESWNSEKNSFSSSSELNIHLEYDI